MMPHTLWQWRRIRPHGEAPPPRCSHSATLSGDIIYVVAGGVAEQQRGDVIGVLASRTVFTHYGDVHALCLRSLRWACVVQDGNGGIQPRRGHSAAVHARSHSILIFSGMGDAGLCDDLVAVRVNRLESATCTRPATSGPAPAPRRGHRAVVVGTDLMIVVGGYGEAPGRNREAQAAVAEGEVRYGDDGLIGMHALDLVSWRWQPLRLCGSVPNGLALFGMTAVPPNGPPRLFCFGGDEFAHFRHGFANTLWQADLSAVVGGRSESGPSPPKAVVPRVAAAGVAADVSDPAGGVVDGAAEVGAAKAADAPIVPWSIIPLDDPAMARVASPHPSANARVATAASALAAVRPSPRFCLELVEIRTAVAGEGEGGEGGEGGVARAAELLVFGGTSEDESALCDMYHLHVPNRLDGGSRGGLPKYRAEAIPVTAEWPRPRNAMTMTCVGSRVVLFGGGVLGSEYFNVRAPHRHQHTPGDRMLDGNEPPARPHGVIAACVPHAQHAIIAQAHACMPAPTRQVCMPFRAHSERTRTRAAGGRSAGRVRTRA